MKAPREASPDQDLRLFAGLAVQPFAAAALGFLAFPLFAANQGGAFSADAALSLAVGAGIVALMVTVFVAMPLALWYSRRGWPTLKQVLLFGVALGNLPVVVIGVLANLSAAGQGRPASLPAGALVAGTAFGLAGALLFWLIAIRGTGRVPERESSGAS
jgi:hypothetical protein